MTATGTTTAMATMPPVDSPLLPVDGIAVLLEVGEEELEVELKVAVFPVVGVVGRNVLVDVEVTVTKPVLELTVLEGVVGGCVFVNTLEVVGIVVGGVVGWVSVLNVDGVVEVWDTVEGVVEVGVETLCVVAAIRKELVSHNTHSWNLWKDRE